jgi:glycosyltransferase involved in cell wall biosynthesis
MVAGSVNEGTSRGAPAVSVVIAAYNRSYTLRHTLRSVLAQDFTDFEVLVIGDACTDDTEDVVASFADRRLRFINLKLNYGEQSGPNNVGVAHAKGRSIAFLSQDDLWFPDHLSAAVGWLEASGADMVHTLVAEFEGGGPRRWAAGLAAEGRGPFFDPFRDVARASCWLVRADVFTRLGPLRPGADLLLEPMQDFLFRVWRAGLEHRIVPHLTVIAVASAFRRESYLKRESPEHELLAELFFDQPDFRNVLLGRIGLEKRSRWSRALDDVAVMAMRPLAWAGIPPRAVRKFVAERGRPRRGAIFEYLRLFRGVDPIMFIRDPLANIRAKEIASRPAYRIGTDVLFGLDHGLGIKESGWADAEQDGTWSDGPEARVAFRLPADYRPVDLDLMVVGSGYLARQPARQRVLVRIREGVIGRFSLDAQTDFPVMKISAAIQQPGRLLRIAFSLPDATQPKRQGVSEDIRSLGIFVRCMRLDYAGASSPVPPT